VEVWISRKRKCGPGGITFDSPRNNQIVVVDQGNHRIQIFDEKGTFIRTFGSKGNIDGRLLDPNGVAVDQEGNYFVSSYFCVQVFDSVGKFLRKFGSEKEGNGQFNYPLGVGVLANGNVVVGDYLRAKCQIFDSVGNFVREFGAGILIFPNHSFVCGLGRQHFGCK